MFFWIAMITFWAAAIKVWIRLGPKIPLIFIGLLCLGFVVTWMLGLTSHIFMTFTALLAAILLIVDRYQAAI